MEAGNVMIMNMWGSRMGRLMDDEGAEEQVYSNITVGGPLTVGGGSTPASTLWWDGWTVAKERVGRRCGGDLPGNEDMGPARQS